MQDTTNLKKVRFSDFRIQDICKAFPLLPSHCEGFDVSCIGDQDVALRMVMQQDRQLHGASRPCAITWLLPRLAELKHKKMLDLGENTSLNCLSNLDKSSTLKI